MRCFHCKGCLSFWGSRGFLQMNESIMLSNYSHGSTQQPCWYNRPDQHLQRPTHCQVHALRLAPFVGLKATLNYLVHHLGIETTCQHTIRQKYCISCMSSSITRFNKTAETRHEVIKSGCIVTSTLLALFLNYHHQH